MNKIVSKLNSIKSLLNENAIAAEGAKYMQSITPFKSGNAKRHTGANGNLIEANNEIYKYKTHDVSLPVNNYQPISYLEIKEIMKDRLLFWHH